MAVPNLLNNNSRQQAWDPTVYNESTARREAARKAYGKVATERLNKVKLMEQAKELEANAGEPTEVTLGGKQVTVRKRPVSTGRANPIGDTIVEYSPGVGDILYGINATKELLKGNLGPAAIGAGMMLLPSTVRGAGKVLKRGKGVAKNLGKDNLGKITYNNIVPFGYSGKSKQFKAMAKDVLSGDHPAMKSVDELVYDHGLLNSGMIDGMSKGINIDKDELIKNRYEAFRKYLGKGYADDNLYLKNGDGTFRYNPERITDTSRREFLHMAGRDSGIDLLTSNGGGVGPIKIRNLTKRKSVGTRLEDLDDVFAGDVFDATMQDVWDLNPFEVLVKENKYLKRLPRKVKEKLVSLEAGTALGVGKPFKVRHSEMYTKEINKGLANDPGKFFKREPYRPSEVKSVINQLYMDSPNFELLESLSQSNFNTYEDLRDLPSFTSRSRIGAPVKRSK